MQYPQTDSYSNGLGRTGLRRLLAVVILLVAAVGVMELPAAQGTAVGSAAPAGSATAMRPSGAFVAVIPIHGMIDHFTPRSVERRTERAMRHGASVIVYELDTDGGLLNEALAISRYIKNLSGVTTIAWIRHRAYSAGILIASACDEIIMTPASSTGDAAPINLLQSNMGPTERAKALSPMLAEFRDNGRRRNLDYALFHAMCVLGIEVYVIENPETGERRLVNQADYAVMVEGEDLAAQMRMQSVAPPDEPELATVAMLDIAQRDDRGRWRAVEILPSGQRISGGRIHDGQTLLTLSQTQAQDVGLSLAVVSDKQALEQYLRTSTIQRVEQSWSETITAFLTSFWVRAILIVLMVVGFYLEANSPGLGVPGAVGLGALLVLIGAPYLAGLAETWHVIALILGLVLIVVEVFLLPSFGLIGVAGLALVFVSLVLSVIPAGPQSPGFGPIRLPGLEAWDRMVFVSVSVIFAAGVALVAVVMLGRYFGHVPLMDRLILRDDASDDPVAVEAAFEGSATAGVSGDEVVGHGHIVSGSRGRASTVLRPSGQAVFEGEHVDVVTGGQMIERGQAVRVVEVLGNRIVVEPDR